jgi:aspartate/methionine/tyrosine aminotransferase
MESFMERKIEGSLISYMSNLVKTSGGINCAQGIPGFEPPYELTEELRVVAKSDFHQYAPGKGLNELREMIAHKTTGGNLTCENFLITNGATEAISLIYLYIKTNFGPDITALSFDPVYESYSNLPRIYGDRFISFTAETDGNYDLDLLESTVKNEKVKIIFMASPGNPYGKIMTRPVIEKIIDICRKNNCFLIFDAVYSDIYFEDPGYLPLIEADKFVFFVSAFSKMLSITGWRIGYLATHCDHIPKLADIHDYTGLSSPSILQKALLNYLAKSDFGKDYVSDIREKIKLSLNTMSGELKKSGFFIPEINGGYFIWTKLPEKYSDGIDFSLKLYEEEKVATVPGIHFSKNCPAWIRINIARPFEEIMTASVRIRDFIS